MLLALVEDDAAAALAMASREEEEGIERSRREVIMMWFDTMGL